MAVRGERFTVGVTPTLLTTAEGDHTAGSSALVKATSANVVLGGPDVTATTGYPLDLGETVGIDLLGDTLYGIVASGTGTVVVLRAGV
jgi:hypothetical protein